MFDVCDGFVVDLIKVLVLRVLISLLIPFYYVQRIVLIHFYRQLCCVCVLCLFCWFRSPRFYFNWFPHTKIQLELHFKVMYLLRCYLQNKQNTQLIKKTEGTNLELFSWQNTTNLTPSYFHRWASSSDAARMCEVNPRQNSIHPVLLDNHLCTEESWHQSSIRYLKSSQMNKLKF